ncbi:MAG: hypothetical protein LQ343_005507 [Gyalolechia ehrenbergii]|nr:MAG: hypothetical protein LQ343_005507 [Gyalolechia ehrenbergii]
MASSTWGSYHKIHEPSFMAACMKINQAVQRGLLNSQAQMKYTKVGVLMMHWDNDDMGVEPLEKDLANLFSKLYNFNVQTFVIPSCPQMGTLMGITNRRLQQFVDIYEGPRSLLIYVYSGHAHAGPPPLYDRCIWLGTTAVPQSRCPQLDWASHRVIPDGAVGDTLYILACHYYATASSAINRSDDEYLVAASMGGNQVGAEAAAQYNKSFTQHLIDLLKHNAGAQSVVSIHASLIANMKFTSNTSAMVAIPSTSELKPNHASSSRAWQKHPMMMSKSSKSQIPLVQTRSSYPLPFNLIKQPAPISSNYKPSSHR